MIFIDKNGNLRFARKKDVDFVFIYEVSHREMQSIALLGRELVKRGFTVGYVNTWHALHSCDMRYSAKVAISFEAYNDSVIDFALSFIEHCDNIYNMQWEQVLSDDCLAEGSVFILSGKANKVFHGSWGQENTMHLRDFCGIPDEQIMKVGHIAFDFLRPEFDGFYMSRETIKKKYGIKSNGKIVLFISSFSDSTFMDEDNKKFNLDSQQIIAEWLVRYTKENPDDCVIYRPHPTEIVDKRLKDELKKGGNIRIIADYSIQQWITITDYMFTWWSTAVGDIYFAGKNYVILRPCDAPAGRDYYMYYNARTAKTYEEMVQQMYYTDRPISDDIMSYTYYYDEKEATYKKIVNCLIKIYDMEPKYEYINKTVRKIKDQKFIIDIREYYGWLKAKIAKLFGVKNSFDEVDMHLKMKRRYYLSEKKIIKMMERIGHFV